MSFVKARAFIVFCIGAMMVFGAASIQAQSSDEEETEFGQLVDEPGVEVTYYTCIACHSEMIIAQQGLSRDHWDDLLVWMVEEQGMMEIDEPERSEILDYLSTHYNEDRPNFPRP
ncbi:MAG: aldehyde dehydrogenase [Roseovarius sp.]